MSQTESPVNSELQREPIGRRQLLKALIAAGGAVTASAFIPAEWTEPVVEMGVLPAHAQISPVEPTPEPPVYTLYCDSVPGGGDITGEMQPGSGYIAEIIATVVLLSGEGSVEGHEVELSLRPDPPPPDPPVFNPPLPITAITDVNGVAVFGNLGVSGIPGQTFILRFAFTDTINDITYEVFCGQYVLGLT